MAFFGVTKEVLEKVYPHNNADKLELGKLINCEFQFVLPKGMYKVGDEVLYIPIDAILPEELVTKIDIKNKRIRTISLRNEISQGLVINTDYVPKEIIDKGTEEITKYLGIVKYEPEEQFTQFGRLQELPSGLSKYDIESCDRYLDKLNELIDEDVVVTEKLEGSNFSISYDGNEVLVNSRNNTIICEEGKELHSYWKYVKQNNLDTKIKALYSGQRITLYGECVGAGIQGNIYKLKSQEVFFFDSKNGTCWLGYNEFKVLCSAMQIKTAPELYKGKLKNYLTKSVRELSNGNSQLLPILREGIVIKPLVEKTLECYGRAIFKQRDPIYLSKEQQ